MMEELGARKGSHAHRTDLNPMNEVERVMGPMEQWVREDYTGHEKCGASCKLIEKARAQDAALALKDQ